MHYGNFTKLERKKSPFSLRERYFNTHFLGLWKMRRNDLLIYSFSHRIETTFSLNSNLMKILRKLIFKVGYCLNNVEIFHVEYPSQYSQKTWFFFTLTISIYQSAHKLRNKLLFFQSWQILNNILTMKHITGGYSSQEYNARKNHG